MSFVELTDEGKGEEGRSSILQRRGSLVFCNLLTTLWLKLSELEFLKRLWGLGTEEEEGYRTGPPGYIGRRNSFLGIDSGAQYAFKNTGSEFQLQPPDVPDGEGCAQSLVQHVC